MVIKYYCIEMSQIGKQHFKKNDAFVKKKNVLCREHVTVFIQIAIDGNVQLVSEFV